MELNLQPMQPRSLRYRDHYKVYVWVMLIISLMVLGFWIYQINQYSWQVVCAQHSVELWMSLIYYISSASSYLLWFKARLGHAMQVHPEYLLLRKSKATVELKFAEVEIIGFVFWSMFYLKMKDGKKFYFSSCIERIDYVWEGLRSARPDLLSSDEYEKFRLRLVQYDHHQKRKEWFFRYKFIDVFNWALLPCTFLLIAYVLQSRDVMIYHKGLYFFRLFMYALLTLLITAFTFSMLLKKLVFDRKITSQMEKQPGDKVRDLEFEGIILQRSKLYQVMTSCFVFFVVIRTDMNLYSIAKSKNESNKFTFQPGKTLLVDNRYNCFNCRYSLTDGDFIIFGRGLIGQVLAKEGELVGLINQDSKGRMLASEDVKEVPLGSIAVKAANGRDIIFVKINELIGKIEK